MILTEDELGRVQGLLDHLGYDLEPSILIIMDPQLRQKLRDILPDYSENTLHSGGRKGRRTKDGVHVDAHLPWESALGTKLRLKVEKLIAHTELAPAKGWRLLNIHAHTATKIAALLDRPNTEKGRERRPRDRPAPTKRRNPSRNCRRALRRHRRRTRSNTSRHLCIAEAFELIPTLASANKQRRRQLSQERRMWVDEAEYHLRDLRPTNEPG